MKKLITIMTALALLLGFTSISASAATNAAAYKTKSAVLIKEYTKLSAADKDATQNLYEALLQSAEALYALNAFDETGTLISDDSQEIPELDEEGLLEFYDAWLQTFDAEAEGLSDYFDEVQIETLAEQQDILNNELDKISASDDQVEKLTTSYKNFEKQKKYDQALKALTDRNKALKNVINLTNKLAKGEGSFTKTLGDFLNNMPEDDTLPDDSGGK